MLVAFIKKVFSELGLNKTHIFWQIHAPLCISFVLNIH